MPSNTNTYRLKSEEVDLAGFVTSSNSNIGAMVCVAPKGDPTKPRLYTSDTNVIKFNGKPSPKYPDLFHAIDFVKTAPLFVITPVASDARYGGVDVLTSSLSPFGIGRDFNTVNYSQIDIPYSQVGLVSGNGVTTTITGTLANTPIKLGTLKIKVNGRLLNISNTVANTISGTDLASGTFDNTTGAYNIVLAGTVGTPAYVISTIDTSAGVDLSAGATNKLINVEIDGVLYSNINLGQSPTTTRASIIAAINAATASTRAIVSGNFIRINGIVGSSTSGKVRILPPTSGTSAMNLVFDATLTSLVATNSISPTGAIPKLGEGVTIEYGKEVDMSSQVHFSVFCESQFDPETMLLAVSVEHISNNQYALTLYQNIVTGLSQILPKTLFSLIQEKSTDGKSLYYEDVFKNSPYIKIKVNASYSGYSDPLSTQVAYLTGGLRGSEPSSIDIFNAWQYFKAKNLYPVKIFMDIRGEQASTVADLVANYQTKGFFLTYVPMGSTAEDSVTYRQGMNIDTDGGALYTNWIKIKDPYNASEVWITAIGKIGAKAAKMVDKYDAIPFAGTDEAGLGGQLGGFQILEVENDYDELTELKIMDEAQVNPIIKDLQDGVMAYGNRTLQSVTTDTSYIHTRRLYNYIMDKAEKEILKRQIFKLNDDLHRLRAKTLADSLVTPILNDGYLNDVYVQCDDGNNGDAVLELRQFILDIYVKAATSSEFVLLRLTRLSQGQVISELIKQ